MSSMEEWMARELGPELSLDEPTLSYIGSMLADHPPELATLTLILEAAGARPGAAEALVHAVSQHPSWQLPESPSLLPSSPPVSPPASPPVSPPASPAAPRGRRRQHQRKQRTVDNLELGLAMEPSGRTEAAPAAMCRHWLSGQCARADCPFSHDPSAHVCSFWLKGRCRKGSKCPFSHQQLPDPTQCVPSTPDPPLDAPPEQPVLSTRPGEWAEVAGRLRPEPLPAAGRASELPPAKLPLVRTGVALAREFAQSRAEAHEQERLARLHREQATNAYRAGEKGLAKQLSRQGQQHQRQAEMLHKQAAASMLSTQNSGLGANAVDMHGLRVQEAELELRRLLNQPGRELPLYLIVGVGKHSSSRGGKLGPALKAVIQEYGLRLSDCQARPKGSVICVYPG